MEDALKRIFILSLWIAGALGLAFLGIELGILSEDFYFIGVVSAIGAYTYVHRPFFKMRFPNSVDLGISILAAVIILLYLASLVVGPNIEQEKTFEVCGSSTTEKKCYSLPDSICKNMWKKYEKECESEIKKEMGDRVTALIGPPIKKCIQKRFDKSLFYTRKTQEPECQILFKSIKE